MRVREFILASLALLFSTVAVGQIAQPGSRPVGLGADGATRSILHLPVSRLGTFDRDSARIAMERADESPLRVYHFAHKQLVDVDIIKEGLHTQLRDGREVWQYRITSPGATSLSFFFDSVVLPEGTLLFVYDEQQREILGGYGAVNVSDTRTLALMPIEGDDVVLELQAPAGSTPQLHLSEVNHGVRAITRAYFGENYGWHQSDLTCTPEVVCMPDLDPMKRAVVAVVIDGISIGSGVMVSTTDRSGVPYLLTAAHVLTENFNKSDLMHQAARTVAIFNFESPSCSGEVMPDISQSVSGATVVGFDKPTDACLLKLNQAPPESYRPYYLGWTAEEHPQGSYINIHHPYVMTKRVNYLSKDIIPDATFPAGGFFAENMHYKVSSWDVGTTAPGSSGSPLIDGHKRVIGALSGGQSECGNKLSDYFSSLSSVWRQKRSSTDAIVRALAPNGGITSDGLDPYRTQLSKAFRLTHVSAAVSGDSLSGSGRQLPPDVLFAGVDAVGEHYLLRPGTQLYGAYVMLDLSRVNRNEVGSKEMMELQVYMDGQGTPVGSFTVDLSEVMRKTLLSPHDKLFYREVFVPFEKPIEVTGGGSFVLAVPTASLPKDVSILHQLYDDNRGQMMGRKGTQWSPRTTTTGTIALWIDPLINDQEMRPEEHPQPLFSLVTMDEDQVMVRIADRVGGGADFSIFTLQGQKLYHRPVTSKLFFLDKNMLEGLGIVVIHLDAGDEQLTIKALFPRD